MRRLIFCLPLPLCPTTDVFAQCQTFATIREVEYQPRLEGDVLTIRKRLRKWEDERGAAASHRPITESYDSAKPINLLTRPRNMTDVSWEGEERDASLDQPIPDTDGSYGWFAAPTDCRPGDLVEHAEEGERLSKLGICLGFINGYYHFYLSTGEWAPKSKVKAKFIVRNFVDETHLEPLVDKLPKEKLSLEALWALSKKKLGPDRVCGAKLLRMMAKFQEESDRVLQEYSTRLENAHELLLETGQRYVTLNEIHECVIKPPEGHKPRSPAPAYELYAMHRTITVDDVGFRPVGTLGDSARSWLFEVTPREDLDLIQSMKTLVRLFTNIPGKVKTPLGSLEPEHLKRSPIGRFVLKAREAIDESRIYRDWTLHGMLGPEKQARPPIRTTWDEVELSILHFMLLWSGYDHFSPSSQFHWIGSTILRATGKYKESDYLSATTGWVFLQEIGYITPWDLHERYTHRLPGVEVSRRRGFAPLPLGPEGIRPYLTQDVFDGRRHDWGDMKVFAIDSKETTDIDDAISVETTDVPGEHWVHIHVADPAARIRHQCALGERPSLTPMTLYLPGHLTNMWGVGDEVQKLCSLGPNTSCLTFSGRVNEKGELLDYKITPAKLHEFIYMTPEDANAATGSKSNNRPPTWAAAESFIVGQPSEATPPGRKMTSPAELQAEELKSLETLDAIARNIRERYLANGALPYYTSRPLVKASFDNTSVEQMPSGLMTCNGDPTITLSWDDNSSDMVANIMQLAGEIAGRWCVDRNIPMPYVTQPTAEANLESVKAYTEKVYYPALLRGEQPDGEKFAQLRSLVGDNEWSTKPGRNFLMGVTNYIKVTSPLRRYTDLLAHWQIEAALAHEMKNGGAARAHPNDLPFSTRELERDVFPQMRLRERLIRQLGNRAGNEAYILQAMLRAWKFPQPEDKDGAGAGTAGVNSRLPKTFRLTTARPIVGGGVGSGPLKRVLVGTLDWFGVSASMVVEGLGKLGVHTDDLRPGDVYEVELVDINVHLRDVLVRATRVIKMNKDLEGGGEGVAAAGVAVEETEG